MLLCFSATGSWLNALFRRSAVVGRKNEKRNNNHQAVGRHTLVKLSFLHSVSITCGSRRESPTNRAAVVLFHCVRHCVRHCVPGVRASCTPCCSVFPTFLLIARAVGVASSGDSCREGLINLLTSTQLGVLTSPRIVESIHVQSWRSTGSACELTLPFVF